MIEGWAVHGSAVVVGLGLASIAEVVIRRVDGTGSGRSRGGADTFIASAVSGLTGPLLGVSLGPRPFAVVDGGALLSGTVISVLGGASIAEVVVVGVDR